MPLTENDIHNFWFNSPDITGVFTSSCGKTVRIIHRGVTNFYDGPDILEAIVSYDGLRFFGNVEFHTKTSDWYTHNHHKDKNYNNVVLHVVSNSKGLEKVRCENGQSIPTICLAGVTQQSTKSEVLSCTGNIIHIHPEIVSLEIEKAAVAYFSELVQRLAGWQIGSGIGQQFKSALICGIFDVLGIPANRDFMHEQSLIFLRAHNFFCPESNATPLESKNKVRWANQTRLRLPQAEIISKNILGISQSQWIELSPELLFGKMLNKAPKLSPRMKQILWCVAVLPSLYLFNNMVGRFSGMQEIFELWKSSEMELPASYVSLLERSEWPQKYIIPNPGLIYKVKHECLQKQCERCEIFQSSLSA